MAQTPELPLAQKPEERSLPAVVRAGLVIGFLYLFLGGVKLLESGIKGLGKDFTDALFENASNPLAALFVGILATVLVQSSSVTTATIVGLVASGVVSVETAVPMIMGANIGTTVTNTLVSLAHARQDDSFRRGFAAATMHDFFNLIAVIVILPLEILTGFLSSAATSVAQFISGGTELGGSFDSPIKGAVKWLAGLFESLFEVFTGNETALAVISIVVGIGLIFLTLTLITRNMRVLVADRVERSLNAALARSGIVGLVVGMLITISVQSSSITTSILIPLVASGLLALRNAYPITLGANIGTTVTALLAALGAGALDGLTIAVTHTLFNILGILLVFPWPKIKYIPVRMAEGLANMAVARKWLALAYVGVTFIAIPLLGIVVL